MLSFTYGEQGSVDLSRGVDCEQETADLNGVTAELYLADNPADESSIVWTVGETSLTISGHLSSQELVELAGSVKKVTEIEEWVWPEYYLPEIPEGYALIQNIEPPHIVFSSTPKTPMGRRSGSTSPASKGMVEPPPTYMVRIRS